MNLHMKSPDNLQKLYAQRARWIMVILNNHSPLDYDFINEELAQSQDRAGPPMLRLATAAMSLEYRRAMPDDADMVTAEENDFSHLMAAHRSVEKSSHYHVWRAMEDFVSIREKLFGQPTLTAMEVPPLDQLDWRVAKALVGIFQCELHYRRKGQPKAELHRMNASLLRVQPLKGAHGIELLGKTVWKLERWNRSGRHDKQRQYEFVMANKALWAEWKANFWLVKSPFANAMGYLHTFYLDFPPAR